MLSAADGLLFPYREIEASGVLMAAIAHGKAIIASRIGSFAETLTESENALLVPAGDPAALASALERFVASATLREMLTVGVRVLRDEIPSWPEIAQATTSVYEGAQRGWRAEFGAAGAVEIARA